MSTCASRGEVSGWKTNSWHVFDHWGEFSQHFRLTHLQVQIQNWSKGEALDPHRPRGKPQGILHFKVCLLLLHGLQLNSLSQATALKVAACFCETILILTSLTNFDKERRLSLISKLELQTGFLWSDIVFCSLGSFPGLLPDHLSAPQQCTCRIASGLTAPWLPETKAHHADCPKTLSLFPFPEYLGVRSPLQQEEKHAFKKTLFFTKCNYLCPSMLDAEDGDKIEMKGEKFPCLRAFLGFALH